MDNVYFSLVQHKYCLDIYSSGRGRKEFTSVECSLSAGALCLMYSFLSLTHRGGHCFHGRFHRWRNLKCKERTKVPKTVQLVMLSVKNSALNTDKEDIF